MEDKNKVFILSWDCYGLECCREIGAKMDLAVQRDKEIVFDLLKDPDQNYSNSPMRELNDLVRVLLIRARTNIQRSYEIYTISTEDSFTEESFKAAFEANPQMIAELVRSRGEKIYSDYNPSHTDFRNEQNIRQPESLEQAISRI